MGKKYIIELEERPFYSGDPMVIGTVITAERLYRVKGFKSLVFDEEGLKRLTPYEEPKPQEKPFDFSKRLAETLLNEWDGSSDTFADACGIPIAVMDLYIAGTLTPGVKEITSMARKLDVSADYLLGLEDAP